MSWKEECTGIKIFPERNFHFALYTNWKVAPTIESLPGGNSSGIWRHWMRDPLLNTSLLLHQAVVR